MAEKHYHFHFHFVTVSFAILGLLCGPVVVGSIINVPGDTDAAFSVFVAGAIAGTITGIMVGYLLKFLVSCLWRCPKNNDELAWCVRKLPWFRKLWRSGKQCVVVQENQQVPDIVSYDLPNKLKKGEACWRLLTTPFTLEKTEKTKCGRVQRVSTKVKIYFVVFSSDVSPEWWEKKPVEWGDNLDKWRKKFALWGVGKNKITKDDIASLIFDEDFTPESKSKSDLKDEFNEKLKEIGAVCVSVDRPPVGEKILTSKPLRKQSESNVNETTVSPPGRESLERSVSSGGPKTIVGSGSGSGTPESELPKKLRFLLQKSATDHSANYVLRDALNRCRDQINIDMPCDVVNIENILKELRKNKPERGHLFCQIELSNFEKHFPIHPITDLIKQL